MDSMMKLSEIKTHADMVASINATNAGFAAMMEAAYGNPNGSSLPSEYGTD